MSFWNRYCASSPGPPLQYFVSDYDSDNPLLRERTSGARHFELIQACRDRDLVHAKRALEIDINELRR